MVNIGYQVRDFKFIDYDLYSLKDSSTDKSFVFRGPPPSTLEKGLYFSSLGAAFTYGCYTQKPYTQLLSDLFNFSSINLGTEGAGPSYFIREDNKFLLDLVNGSRFAVISFMSAKSCSNSLFKVSPESQEKISFFNQEHYQPAHKLYQWLLENKDEDFVRNIVQETRNKYVEDFVSLLKSIKVPKILIWFSKGLPNYQESYTNDVWKLFGDFPQLVNSAMVDEVKLYCDDYIECVTSKETPQVLLNRFESLLDSVKKDPAYGYSSSNYNLYYATPEMHIDAANFLISPCSKYLPEKVEDSSLILADFPNYLQVKDLFDYLLKIYFQNFLKDIVKTSKVVIFSEPDFRNYLYFNDNLKEFSTKLKTYTDYDKVFNLYDDNSFDYYIDFTINSRKNKTSKNKEYIRKITLNKSQKIIDWLDDIVPYLLSKPTKMSLADLHKKLDSRNNPEILYSIFCTERSGSTFFCDLLNQNLGGNPIEHIRGPLLYLTKNRYRLNLDVCHILEKVSRFGCSHKAFGTKIISHFLFKLIEMLDRHEISKLIGFLNKSKIIYLYREDKYAQAVSKYIASSTKQWHIRSFESLQQCREKADQVSYNFNLLKEIYENFMAEEEKLKSFIELNFKQILPVKYEDIVNQNSESQGNIEKVIAFIKPDVQKLTQIQSEYKILSSGLNHEIIARFKEDYEANK